MFGVIDNDYISQKDSLNLLGKIIIYQSLRLGVKYMASKDFLNKCLDLHTALLGNRVDASIKFRGDNNECIISANGKSRTYTADNDIDIGTELKVFLR